MPRPSNTEDRRREIVRALLRLLGSVGYDGASIQAIAREAGLSSGLVHYHFANKQEILLELASTLERNVAERYSARCGPDDPPWSRLDAFIDARLALGDDADMEAVRCWAVVSAEALRRPALRSLYQSAIDAESEQLRALVRAVLRDQGLDLRGASSKAAGLLSAIHGALHLGVSGARFPKGFAAPTVRAMARGLLLAPASGETR